MPVDHRSAKGAAAHKAAVVRATLSQVRCFRANGRFPPRTLRIRPDNPSPFDDATISAARERYKTSLPVGLILLRSSEKQPVERIVGRHFWLCSFRPRRTRKQKCSSDHQPNLFLAVRSRLIVPAHTVLTASQERDAANRLPRKYPLRSRTSHGRSRA